MALHYRKSAAVIASDAGIYTITNILCTFTVIQCNSRSVCTRLLLYVRLL